MSGLKLALSALVIFAVFVSTAQADYCEDGDCEDGSDYIAEDPECLNPGMVPCGEPCKGMGFVCDGKGYCVDASENPCLQAACGGIGCGDSCFMRDINVAGVCDSDARCATVAFDRKVEC